MQDVITKVLSPYSEQCFNNLLEYYNLIAEGYHQYIIELINEKTKHKDSLLSQLSDDEKKLNEDNDWLTIFKEKLVEIERK